MDFSEQLSRVLTDPESMKAIRQIAQNLSADEKAAPKSAAALGAENSCAASAQSLPFVSDALKLFQNGSRERVALLSALRPFIKEDKRERLDRIIQTLRMLDVLCLAQKSV